jgi:hypothetical protein
MNIWFTRVNQILTAEVVCLQVRGKFGHKQDSKFMGPLHAKENTKSNPKEFNKFMDKRSTMGSK